MVGGVPVALLGTRDARPRARLDRRADEAAVGTALPRRDARGRLADVRAVETDADDADQLRQVALAQAGVGAGGAAGTAIETLLGTPKERLAEIAPRQRVQLHDLAKGHLPERAGEPAIRGIREVQRDRRRSRLGVLSLERSGRAKMDGDNSHTVVRHGARLLGASGSDADKMVAREQRPADSSPAVTTEDVARLAQALREAKRAHAVALAELRQAGVDPVEDWAVWYAEYLLGVR
jgi:hypothetical protein